MARSLQHTLKLHNSKYFVEVDDEETVKKLMKYKWNLMQLGTICSTTRFDGKQINITNYLMDDYVNMFDHKDRNIFNCKISNLRIATKSQNSMNMGKRKKPCSSIYKGVSLNKKTKQWRAYISLNGVRYALGEYATEKSAALVYNQKAIQLFKEFACLNDLEDSN